MTIGRRRRRHFQEVVRTAKEGDISRALALARAHLQTFPNDVSLLDKLDKLTATPAGIELRAEFIELRCDVIGIDVTEPQ